MVATIEIDYATWATVISFVVLVTLLVVLFQCCGGEFFAILTAILRPEELLVIV